MELILGTVRLNIGDMFFQLFFFLLILFIITLVIRLFRSSSKKNKEQLDRIEEKLDILLSKREK
ncbi:DUF4083 family protein [Ornithinibacillus halotolerans]|uniref:DUF4083 domain-containing protein n=1 Tax=Ornithinibacillus halotolerans TaxID=1274357 RepID=A0A916WDV0_9BACI|nr:DUF4083 family protein [Ornithinibacillus halotolerans]GGA89724.1 hypothetical protein GCM10008025_35410 [Ornithinibacillus halotolerans]